MQLLLWGASFSALLWINNRIFWKSRDGLASLSVQSSLVLTDGGSIHHIPVEGGTGQDVESSRTPGELPEKGHLSSSPLPQVVIAMASYPQPHMYWDSAFVWSLRCAGYKDDLVLVVPPEMHTAPPHKLADFFRDMAVTTQAMAKGSACDDEAGSVDPRCLGPEFGRYVEYEKALEAYTNEDTRVLLIDFRDTMFQVSGMTRTPTYPLGGVRPTSYAYPLSLRAVGRGEAEGSRTCKLVQSVLDGLISRMMPFSSHSARVAAELPCLRRTLSPHLEPQRSSWAWWRRCNPGRSV